MTKLTEKQEKILSYLAGRGWTSPTEIGQKLFKKRYDVASSHVSPTCKILVKLGLLERSSRGHYKVKGD